VVDLGKDRGERGKVEGGMREGGRGREEKGEG